ncbi:ABC transporter ATP-binding protein [Paenibacillus hexagrammi]|uniref:ABC transporter ATP-binding protein/permease n=1 Tax=Paenibacillus hexagrammi TaxID=2908839 RepID=A0ABY3SKF2_9BACL|nr:ABC transporter ATP-binding protein [Paenibacillus sp. YPD9-1]UJF33462.1 ABC transporter ATP-binding protein/permease [Paenibacillus sp. YPD9-1]
MWRLRSFVKPYLIPALLAPLMMILEVCMDLSQPRLMAIIVNHGVVQGNIQLVWSTGIHMIEVALIGLVGGVGCTIFSSKASQSFGADLRIALYTKVQSFSFRQMDLFQTGSLITRLTGDVVQMLNLLQMLLRQCVRETSLLTGSIIMAVMISPRLSSILAIVIPVQLFILITLMRRTAPLFRTLQGRLDKVNTVLQENTAGMRVIKAFVRSAFEQKRFGKANSDYLETGLKAARIFATNTPLMTLILNASVVAVIWFGAGQAWKGSMAIGDLAAFLIYITQVLFSLVSISNTWMNISRAKVSADRICEVLETEPDLYERLSAEGSARGDEKEAGNITANTSTLQGGLTISHDAQALYNSREDVSILPSGRIDFEQVSFAYDSSPDQTVLENISFTALPGQTIGILGATGAGKSTLVSLLPRLYEVTKGRILIDGTDIREMPVHTLRSKIGIVLQQSILFTGTIGDNIRFGNPGASQTEVEAAALAAEAHEFICRLPEGYEARLGQRGVNLSGGQKQRLSIARTLLLKPSILVLDDSTSAIDLSTERRIQRSLQSLMKTSTCIVIAQRISSVMSADQILVLDQGRIAAQGTHEELLASSRIYQDIYQSQQGKETAAHG